MLNANAGLCGQVRPNFLIAGVNLSCACVEEISQSGSII